MTLFGEIVVFTLILISRSMKIIDRFIGPVSLSEIREQRAFVPF